MTYTVTVRELMTGRRLVLTLAYCPDVGQIIGSMDNPCKVVRVSKV